MANDDVKWVPVDSFQGAGVPLGFVPVVHDSNVMPADVVSANYHDETAITGVPYVSWDGEPVVFEDDEITVEFIDETSLPKRGPGRPRKDEAV